MRKYIVGYVLAIVAVVVLLLVTVPRLIPAEGPGLPEDAGAVRSATEQSPTEAAAARAARPGCPAGTVAGVALDCLATGPGEAPGALGIGEDAGGADGGGNPDEVSDGRLVLVNLWAWWCAPCREELPLIARFQERHPEIPVIGVHVDRDAGRGAALLTDLDVDLVSYQDPDGAFAGRHGLPAVLPVTVLVRDGEVVARFPRVFRLESELEEAILEAGR